MNLDYETLEISNLKTCKKQVGPEWRTENFMPAWRIISQSRLYFPVDGEGTVEDNGNIYHLKPGMMLLIPAFANVKVSCPKTLTKYWIHFNAMLAKTRTDVFFLHGSCMEIPVAGQMDYYRNLFERLMETEKQNRPRIDNFEHKAVMKLLLTPFLRLLAEFSPDSSLTKTVELLQYIDRNCCRDLTLKELSRVACIHPNYLCTSFHRTMHMTLSRYINLLRFDQALEYFKQGEKTLSEIAEAVGYSSVQAFSKAFRRTYGMSPRSYLADSGKSEFPK